MMCITFYMFLISVFGYYFSTTEAKTECCRNKPNEEFTPEKNCCPPETCESLVSRYDCSDAPPPIPGCVCKSGYKRLNETSPCIPICECPEMASSPECQPTCDCPNEEWLKEKPSCPPETCVSLVSRYDCSDAPPPKPGCACKSGYKRLNETSPCKPICECPEMASSPECQPTYKCPNEEWLKEKPSCPPETCVSLVSRYDCSDAPPPKPGCGCRSGYKRLNETSPCIPICECPEMASSPECQPTCECPNEEWLKEKPSCPPETCVSLVSRYDCSDAPPPKPGCACKSGYKRLNETSPCKPICECPEMASSPECQPTCDCSNEEWSKQKPSCPPETCVSLVSRYDCSDAPPPKPGCACKSGYKRLNETSPCKPICECPEMASSPECQPTCDCSNEEWSKQKPSCPPETCVSLVSRYDCSDAAPPKPGCACKSGYKRLNESSPCKPICECPQMASSPDCQPSVKYL